jgi:hypothetical protein
MASVLDCQIQSNYPSMTKEVADYVKSGKGSYRVASIFDTACKWPLRFATSLGLTDRCIEILSSTKEIFGFAKSAGSVSKFIGTVCNDLIPACQDPKKSVIKPTLNTVSDGMRVFQLVDKIKGISLPSFMKRFVGFSAETSSLITEGINISEHSKKTMKFHSIESHFDGKVKKEEITFAKESKRLAFFKLVKSVSSVATILMTTFTMMFGCALTGTLAFMGLSTFGTGLAIYNHFYEKFMTYKPLKDSDKVELSTVSDEMRSGLIRHLAV